MFDRLRMQQLESLRLANSPRFLRDSLGRSIRLSTRFPDLWEVSKDTRDEALAEGNALAEELGIDGFEMVVNSRSFFQSGPARSAGLRRRSWEVTLNVGDSAANAELIQSANFEMSMSTPNVVLPSVSAFLLEQYLPGGREANAAPPPDVIYDLLADLQGATDPIDAHAATREIQRVMREDWIPVVPMGKQVGSSELIAITCKTGLARWVNGSTCTLGWMSGSTTTRLASKTSPQGSKSAKQI